LFRQGREARRGERKEKREAEEEQSGDIEKKEDDGDGVADDVEAPEK